MPEVGFELWPGEGTKITKRSLYLCAISPQRKADLFYVGVDSIILYKLRYYCFSFRFSDSQNGDFKFEHLADICVLLNDLKPFAFKQTNEDWTDFLSKYENKKF